MKRIFISFITATIVLFNTISYAENYETQMFKDVPSSHWAFSYIEELVSDRVIDGYPDNSFKPENKVSRAEFAKIMVTAAGLTAKNTGGQSFDDVSISDWHYPYIETAKDFLTGYDYEGKSMYLPNTMAKREDIAVALVKLKGYDVSVADLSMLRNMFVDYESISSEARKYVAVAVERGIVSGYEDNTFKAQQSITRAEAAALIWRANQYGNDNKFTNVSDATLNSTSSTVSVNPTVTTVPKSEKEYIVDTLYDCGNIISYCYDGDDTIYYLSENSVYKLNVNTEKSELIVDASDFVFNDTRNKFTKTALSAKSGEKKYTVSLLGFDKDEADETQSIYCEETDESNSEAKETLIPKITEEPILEPTEEPMPIPTLEPTEEPMPISTLEPTEEPMPISTLEPTEEPTPVPTAKPTKTTEPEDKSSVVYSKFEASRLLINQSNKHLILVGEFRQVTKPYNTPSNSHLGAVYDLNKKEIIFADEYSWSTGGSGTIGSADMFFASELLYMLNDDKVIAYTSNTGCTHTTYIDTKSRSRSDMSYVDSSGYSYAYVTFSNKLFEVSMNKWGKIEVSEFNFLTGKLDKAKARFTSDSVGCKGESIYILRNDSASYSDSDRNFYKINLSTGASELLNISIKEDKCEVIDMAKITMGCSIIPISDDFIVFYDKGTNSFRKIIKNI